MCNVGSVLLATDFELFQSPGTQGQNIRPNRLSHTEVWYDNVLFVNETRLLIFLKFYGIVQVLIIKVVQYLIILNTYLIT